jgi:branched-chain amino acid transport system permease protein
MMSMYLSCSSRSSVSRARAVRPQERAGELTVISLSDIPARGGSPLTLPMGLFLAALTAPLWLAPIGLYQYLGIEIAIWMIFALGFNLLFGYTGLHSFGHGAYLGIGAYAFGLFQQNVAVSLWGGLRGGHPRGRGRRRHCRRLHVAPARHLLCADDHRLRPGLLVLGHQAALAHRGRGRTSRHPAPRPRAGPVARGARRQPGVLLVRRGLARAGHRRLWRLVNAPLGRVLQAIRQNETRARFVGYDVWAYKWATFVLSAGFAGLAGGLFAMAQQSAYPDVMSLHQSGLIVMMVLVGGGLVSFWGPVLGVILYFVARDVIGGITETWLLWFGLMFVVMVMVRPEGMAGLIHGLTSRRAFAARPPARPSRRKRDGALHRPERPEAVRRPRRAGERLALGRGGHGARHHGAERGGQDHLLPRAHRPPRARRGHHHLRRARHHRDEAAPHRADGHLAVVPDHEPLRRHDRHGERHARSAAVPRHGPQPVPRRLQRQSADRPGARRARPGGLADRAWDNAKALSYGDRRALEIAVALAAGPRIVFLDEPTSGLGAEATRNLAALVGKLRQRYTIVVIEHDMRFLFDLADRISVIHWGQVIAEDTPAALRENKWVARSALGEVA